MRWSAFFILSAILLSACASQEDTINTNSNGAEAPEPILNVASASGRILPATRANLGFETGGRIDWIVAEASQVAAGDVLAWLDTTALDAAIVQAQAGLDAAEAQLALATEGVAEADIAAATSSVTIAQANVALATAELKRAESAAELAVDAAQADLNRAQGLLDLAEAELDTVSSTFEETDPQVAAARANVAVAEAGVAAAETALADAEDSSALTEAAGARLRLAQGQRDQAQANLDALTAGPSELELETLNAQVAQAEANVSAAEAALENATLTAPFSGTVAAVHFYPGEVVMPGQPILSLGDLSTLRIETTDLNETDAAQMEVGMQATVSFDALPGYVTRGTIVDVASMASQGQGGTSFRLIVELESLPLVLRWGMTAFVDVPLD